MKPKEEVFKKQVSTTLTEGTYAKWLELCKSEGKTSFMMLREIIQIMFGERQ